MPLPERSNPLGVSNPNPSVGAVVVWRGKIVAKGHTQVPYREHAEVIAIQSAQKKLRTNSLKGCTLYVTLEPCCHYGRTPPCTHAIIQANISQVVIAVLDPNPGMRGKSIGILQQAGCSVEVLQAQFFFEEIFFTLGGFFYLTKYKRPRIFSKWAQTKNGYLAPFQSSSGAISNPMAKEVVFLLRKVFHTTMATPNTILYDRCSLTIRKTQVKIFGKRQFFF